MFFEPPYETCIEYIMCLGVKMVSYIDDFWICHPDKMQETDSPAHTSSGCLGFVVNLDKNSPAHTSSGVWGS